MPQQGLLVKRAADSIPDRLVLDRCDSVEVSSGREFLRGAMVDATEHQAAIVKGKPRLRGPAPAARGGGKGPLVAIISSREGDLSRRVRRLICRFGGRNSSSEASASPLEGGGWTVSGETIRKAFQVESKPMADRWADSDLASEDFRAAEGLAKFPSDFAKVNTDSGWCDVKIGIFARRPADEPATSEDWADGKLPPPPARVVFFGLESSEVFGAR